MGLFSQFWVPAQWHTATADASRRCEAIQLQAIMRGIFALLQNKNGRVFRLGRLQNSTQRQSLRD